MIKTNCMSTQAHIRSGEVTGVMLCFEVSIPPTHTLSPSAVSFLMNCQNWSSYKLGLSSKGSINTLTPFMRVIKQPLLGIRGSRLGRDCPGWLMSRMGMVAHLGASELWACSKEARGGGAYWELDSLVKRSQIYFLCNRAGTTKYFYYFTLFSVWEKLSSGIL